MAEQEESSSGSKLTVTVTITAVRSTDSGETFSGSEGEGSEPGGVPRSPTPSSSEEVGVKADKPTSDTDYDSDVSLVDSGSVRSDLSGDFGWYDDDLGEERLDNDIANRLITLVHLSLPIPIDNCWRIKALVAEFKDAIIKYGEDYVVPSGSWERLEVDRLLDEGGVQDGYWRDHIRIIPPPTDDAEGEGSVDDKTVATATAPVAAVAAAPSVESVPGSSTSNSSGSETKKKSNRCQMCRKRVGLTGFECRCGGLFCSLHRYSDKHECSFDYRQLGAEEIRKNNPVVVGEKIHKI